MLRKIIHIDEEKCNGCGLCANACHEGAIDIIDGKAKLVRENFCDGFGDCLPNCPMGAISFEEREAPAYDEAAVKESQKRKAAAGADQNGKDKGRDMNLFGKKTDTAEQKDAGQQAPGQNAGQQGAGQHAGGGCPGSRVRDFRHQAQQMAEEAAAAAGAAAYGAAGSAAAGTAGAAGGMTAGAAAAGAFAAKPVSRLQQWPVQLKLLPTKADFYDGAKLLIAADCTAFSYAAMHEDFMKGKITVIGCPKLDMVDYTEKLTEIISNNDIKSVSIVRMEVPCCGGLQRAAENALKASGKFIPWQVTVISLDGRILD